jgi:UDP-glucose:(heptosyl)LPS alpha-1,3-glucosyltransferase
VGVPAELAPVSGAPARIAIVRARYNPFGGAERFVQRALGALAARGVEVTVIARRWPQGAPAAGELAPRMVRVDPFYVGSVWRDWSFARAVRRLLARESFSVVQSHERIPGVAVYRAGDGVHATFLEQRRRAVPRWRAWALRANPYHAYVLATERAMFTDPALRAVICNASMVRDDIRSRFGVPAERLHVIRNGVDLDRFRPPSDAERAHARRALGLSDAATAFAFVGSGFERKGLAAAIRALARLAGERDVRLLAAGSDRRAARYRRLAASLGVGERVRLLGGVEDVVPLLWAADAFVLPTLYDPFPNAALEALACGLPVVTSTGSGASELVRDGVNGWVVDALDLEALAAAMRRLCEPGARAAMSGPARDSVQALSLDALAGQLIALYGQLLSDVRSSPLAPAATPDRAPPRAEPNAP